MRKALILIAVLGGTCQMLAQVHPETGEALAYTYSIVARDEATGEMAVGVQSHWFSVGTIVCWGRSGVGVVATQSFVNPAYGPVGLDLMESGIGAEQALTRLVAEDEGRAYRQVAFLDKEGRVEVYTGSSCVQSAGHIKGDNYSVQANMMLNDRVVPAMSAAYKKSRALPLARRVVEAMKAAQEAGGDIRGKQSAALLVVGPEKVEEAWKDKKIDLRVDDHAEPVKELERLLNVHMAYEHMNRGDLAVENGDMVEAMEEYGAAEALFPENLEMKYWKAVTLANNGRLIEAIPVFKYIFDRDPNWKTMTSRLPSSGLLSLPDDEFETIMNL